MELRNEQIANYESEGTTFDVKLSLKGGYQTGAVLANKAAVVNYLKEQLCDSANEQGFIICVNTQCQAINTARVGIGGLSGVDMDIANIAKIALLSNASAVFIAHNHPGDTCAPSHEDIIATKRIKDALAIFNIRVFDHIICCPSGACYSFSQHGDL